MRYGFFRVLGSGVPSRDPSYCPLKTLNLKQALEKPCFLGPIMGDLERISSHTCIHKRACECAYVNRISLNPEASTGRERKDETERQGGNIEV